MILQAVICCAILFNLETAVQDDKGLNAATANVTAEKSAGYQTALDQGDYKKAICILQEQIDYLQESEKGNQFNELALLYLKDQNQEQAFEFFLKALAAMKVQSAPPPFDEREYRKAFAIYLDPSSKSPQETAKKLITEIEPILKNKPDEHLLDYFIAIGYANLGKYQEFFYHFYKAFQNFPDHYLAYKTKAVLHIKLLERKRNQEERNLQRQKIKENLNSALNLESLDTTIYKLLISFSPEEEKNEQIRRCLNKIIGENITIPRKELMFYVIEAIDAEERGLAAKFLKLSKEWYPQSRIVSAAQCYLDAHN